MFKIIILSIDYFIAFYKANNGYIEKEIVFSLILILIIEIVIFKKIQLKF